MTHPRATAQQPPAERYQKVFIWLLERTPTATIELVVVGVLSNNQGKTIEISNQ
jgi:hypothetical protein